MSEIKRDKGMMARVAKAHIKQTYLEDTCVNLSAEDAQKLSSGTLVLCIHDPDLTVKCSQATYDQLTQQTHFKTCLSYVEQFYKDKTQVSLVLAKRQSSLENYDACVALGLISVQSQANMNSPYMLYLIREVLKA